MSKGWLVLEFEWDENDSRVLWVTKWRSLFKRLFWRQEPFYEIEAGGFTIVTDCMELHYAEKDDLMQLINGALINRFE